MKHILFLACSAMLLTFSFCKERDPLISTQHVSGAEATIAWQGCTFFTDHDITICFVGANEYRCPCDSECLWEGAVDATLRVSTPTGIDTTITLTTNSNPVNLPNTATIGGKTIRFVSTTPTPLDCADYGNYEKYKVNITVE